jgi:glycerol kinase
MTERRFVLALDQGTTGSRAMVVDADGAVRGSGYVELTQHYPRPGWVEHDAEEIWTTTVHAIGEALAAARITGTEIAAVGITNQRETTVLWERASGRPVHRAIVWQCRRTAPLCERLKADGAEPAFKSKTGLMLDPYFSGTKIRWLLDEVPGARDRAERGELAFGTVDSWLLWRLTGGAVHATDPSNASRTLCFDIRALRWDNELCRLLGVPLAVLPTSSPRSPDLAPRTGIRTPAACSWASRAAPPALTSRWRPLRPSPTRTATCSTPWPRKHGRLCERCGSTAGRPRTTFSVSSRPTC